MAEFGMRHVADRQSRRVARPDEQLREKIP